MTTRPTETVVGPLSGVEEGPTVKVALVSRSEEIVALVGNWWHRNCVVPFDASVSRTVSPSPTGSGWLRWITAVPEPIGSVGAMSPCNTTLP